MRKGNLIKLGRFNLSANDFKKLYCLPDLRPFVINKRSIEVMKKGHREDWDSIESLVSVALEDLYDTKNVKYIRKYEDYIYAAYDYVKKEVGWYTYDEDLYQKIWRRGYEIRKGCPNKEVLIDRYSMKARTTRRSKFYW